MYVSWYSNSTLTANHCSIFFLFVYVMSIVMRGWFRMLASAFKSSAPANTVAGISTLVLAIYTGYTIPRPSMIGALRWITYINPLRYGFEGVLVNEFHTLDGTCATLVPQGAGYENIGIQNQVCTTIGSIPGQSTVNGERFVELSYGYSYGNLWMGQSSFSFDSSSYCTA
jgi:ATP-binding cassette subfamily G (WHITE) protein 2 (SNQ2)